MFRRSRLKPVLDVAAVYADLREMVVTLDPSDYDFPPLGDSQLFGALMELGYEDVTATVVALTDGTTSLYTTSGYGVIGGGAHESVRQASAAWLLEMSALVPDLALASEVEPPATSDVQFIALTHAGARVGQASEVSVRRGDEPFGSLYRSGQRVLTELRLVEEDHRRSPYRGGWRSRRR